jgi:ATP-dependent RNA helicase RhlE
VIDKEKSIRMKFEELNLNKSILRAIEDLELENPTPIQEQVFSVAMSGRDICGIAQTGTGKTLAYLLPLLRMWTFSKEKLPQILILVPTRELVVQVVEVAQSLTTYMSFDTVGVYGGINMKTHVAELLNGCDLLVATPGRFTDLAAAGAIKVKNIKKLVIDEFDMMLDLGFRPQLELIFDKIPEKRQNLLFSATMTKDAEEILDVFFKSPVQIETPTAGSPLDSINQKAYLVPNFQTKINFIEVLLANDKEMTKNLIFVTNKAQADILLNELTERGIEDVDVIHSNKSQNFRFNAIKRFESGEIKTLICTDIVSRGLDLTEVSHVVNFELPEDPEIYIHRIGRTGRAQQNGTSISMISPREIDLRVAVEELMGEKLTISETPSFIEVSDRLMIFEIDEPVMKVLIPKKKVDIGPAFHEKKEKNKKVNVRRNIEAEKKRKYGKSYKKEIPK